VFERAPEGFHRGVVVHPKTTWQPKAVGLAVRGLYPIAKDQVTW
jgi:hypothetical protein